MNKIEILAPAGGEETARLAIGCGADAVYLGLSRFSARSAAENFDFSALSRTADYAHLLGAKVYVCLNTLVKDGECADFFEAARTAWNCGADAILMQDLFLGEALKQKYPKICLHLSTQAGCCNEWGARLAKECGFSRVVLARETPIGEIRKIAGLIETEVFVQGALCTSFSGQCYLSSFAGNNSGNRGRCKQPCRKKYSIDRAGFEEPRYALSPCDLCVGERIQELAAAGVISFKIEGRLRRSEYVAAAVRYYRALLAGGEGKEELSDLKRAFNRGDYTEGLAFGQHAFLSRKVQGHIGEKVGTLRDDLVCKSNFKPQKGDGFKILRQGFEVGGAVLDEKEVAGGFRLVSNQRLRPGDEVRLTTDSALPERVFSAQKRKIGLEIELVPGEAARISCGEFVWRGEGFPEAKSAPLSREEVEACFRKTDLLPFSPEFLRVEIGNVFAPKAKLNEMRRNFYEALAKSLLPSREPLPVGEMPAYFPEIKGDFSSKTAIIAEDFEGLEADFLIYKPRDYRAIDPGKIATGKGKKYLYLPPFFTGADLSLAEQALKWFDGVYCDGFYGLLFAKEHGCGFFAGTGFNLTNRFAVEGVKRAGARCFALSKELSAREQDALATEGAFALKRGAIKVMDLCYCPFECICKDCDRQELYRLTDEEGRRFPLRRYRAASEFCRFEVYNCAPLLGGGELAGTLVDQSVRICAAPTKGHAERSMI